MIADSDVGLPAVSLDCKIACGLCGHLTRARWRHCDVIIQQLIRQNAAPQNSEFRCGHASHASAIQSRLVVLYEQVNRIKKKPCRAATLETTLISKRQCYAREGDGTGGLGAWGKIRIE